MTRETPKPGEIIDRGAALLALIFAIWLISKGSWMVYAVIETVRMIDVF